MFVLRFCVFFVLLNYFVSFSRHCYLFVSPLLPLLPQLLLLPNPQCFLASPAFHLILFLFYFGAHAKGVRMYALYFLAALTFLWQGGWLRRRGGAAAGAGRGRGRDGGRAVMGDAGGGEGDADADADGDADRGGDVAVPRPRARTVSATEAPVDPDAPPPTLLAAAAAAAQRDAEHAREAAVAAHAAMAPLEGRPVPSLPMLIGTVIFKFFSSLIPADGPPAELD